MKYWHIRGNKDDLRCSLVSMLILYETRFNPLWIVPVRVTKLPTTFFMFTKVPSTYLDQWLALSTNFPREYTCSLTIYSENQIKIFSGLICPKMAFEKQNSFFWQKAWTNPFGKFYFLDVFKSSLILSKNYSFLLRISENDLSLLDFEKTRSMD